MFTRFAASTVSTSNNMVSIIFLLAYGPNSEKQFIQKSKQYNFDVDDVLQDAHVIYIVKNHLYEESKGTRAAFLWAFLNKLLLRKSLGPSKFAISLDDDSEMARLLNEKMEALPAEEIEYKDISEYEITSNAILEECRKFALSISGKSAKELSILWGKSERRVNQIIAEWCAIARAERLRTKK